MRLPRRGLVFLLAATLLALGVGFLIKDACNGPPWDGRHPYVALCYHDIRPLYSSRHLRDDTLPYVDRPGQDPPGTPLVRQHGFLEYPVLTGLLVWSATMLGTLRSETFGGVETVTEFVYWNDALLAPFALATTWLLARMTYDPRRVLLFALGTPLALYAFHNWDLLPVFFTVLGLYWWEKDSFARSGAAFGLGIASKIYPVVIPPVLFLLLLRKHYDAARPGRSPSAALGAALAHAKPAWTFAGAAAGVVALLHLPFLLFGSRALLLETYLFHLRRGPNVETVWYAVQYYAHRWDVGPLLDPASRPLIETFALTLTIIAFGLLAAAAWTRRVDARHGALAALLLFMLLNKVFSVQYILWILPFFALARLPLHAYALYVLVDVWVYATLFPYFVAHANFLGRATIDALAADDDVNAAYAWAAVAILARAAALLYLLVLAVTRKPQVHDENRGSPVVARPEPSASRPA